MRHYEIILHDPSGSERAGSAMLERYSMITAGGGQCTVLKTGVAARWST